MIEVGLLAVLLGFTLAWLALGIHLDDPTIQALGGILFLVIGSQVISNNLTTESLLPYGLIFVFVGAALVLTVVLRLRREEK